MFGSPPFDRMTFTTWRRHNLIAVANAVSPTRGTLGERRYQFNFRYKIYNTLFTNTYGFIRFSTLVGWTAYISFGREIKSLASVTCLVPSAEKF
uniref:Uncharacterized protein n=1 Tax=Romanomermis culicivorax TaxID=13658 RepID=A0A915KKU9_ROMCU